MQSKIYDYVVGIDVSKDTLSISIFDGKSYDNKEIKYNKISIKKELITKFKKLKDKVVFVMEATGVYHTKLAFDLYENGFKVSVVNPLSIKRYSQLKLLRVKTDKTDAKLIASYAYEFQDSLTLYIPQDKQTQEIKMLINALDDLNKQQTAISNQLHALKYKAFNSKEILNSYKKHIEFIKREKKRLTLILNQKLKENFKQEYELLNKIPGVGLKVTSTIIAIFNGFKTFDSAKQACSFIGIAPSPYMSGTSVKGRGGISKKGNPMARKILYVATLSAIRYNSIIKRYYERLLSRGKAKMVAVIACANKLLRIAFGVLKSGEPFSENYVKVR